MPNIQSIYNSERSTKKGTYSCESTPNLIRFLANASAIKAPSQ